jgi:hypothetical protein
MNIKNILLSCLLLVGLSEVVYSQEYGEGSEFDPLRGRNKFDPIPVYIISELGGRPMMDKDEGCCKYYLTWTANEDTNFVSYKLHESMSEDMTDLTLDTTITVRENAKWGCYDTSRYLKDGTLIHEKKGCKGMYKIEVKDSHITKLWGNPSKYYQVIVTNTLGLTTASEIVKW